jgi:hypothetical protein
MKTIDRLIEEDKATGGAQLTPDPSYGLPAKKPTIELKKVHHSKSLSEETPAYSAQVFVDGVHFCDVTNHGTGGPDDYHSYGDKTFAEDLKALNERIGATFPKFGQDYNRDGWPRDLEVVCHELLDEAAIAKDLSRLLKRTVAFFDPAKREVRSFKGKHEGVARAHLITAALRKTPDAIILNNLPFVDALTLFKSAAAALAIAFFVFASPPANAHPNHICHFHATVQHCR